MERFSAGQQVLYKTPTHKALSADVSDLEGRIVIVTQDSQSSAFTRHNPSLRLVRIYDPVSERKVNVFAYRLHYIPSLSKGITVTLTRKERKQNVQK